MLRGEELAFEHIHGDLVGKRRTIKAACPDYLLELSVKMRLAGLKTEALDTHSMTV